MGKAPFLSSEVTFSQSDNKVNITIGPPHSQISIANPSTNSHYGTHVKSLGNWPLVVSRNHIRYMHETPHIPTILHPNYM